MPDSYLEGKILQAIDSAKSEVKIESLSAFKLNDDSLIFGDGENHYIPIATFHVGDDTISTPIKLFKFF